MPKLLPDFISRQQIIEAIHAYNSGISHKFDASRIYDVMHDGLSYPPKAIVGIAATKLTGVEFTPEDFTGGIKSKCVKLLTNQGFEIRIKKGKAYFSTNNDHPDELHSTDQFWEGSTKQITVNLYERDIDARKSAIAHHGTNCQVCNIDFCKIYGEIGEGFIHIHHLIPLSTIKENYRVDPIKDLIPVCPNCHAMLHKRIPPFTPEELKGIISKDG